MRFGLLLVSFMTVPVTATEPLASGVAVGGKPGPYSFLVATGTERGQPTCYICDQGDKPAVVVFARTLSAPLGKLLVTLEGEVAARKESGFKVWLTQLTDKADLDALAKWGQTTGLKNVPLGAFEDPAGPPSYTLAAAADVTVLLFVKRSITANHAYKAGELNDAAIAAIGTGVSKLVPSK